MISDNGTGIPEEVKDKIFDPFFTTKELGKGTGLGLSTALGIVKSHKGFINVYSEAGQGTKFTVYLPAHMAGRTAQLAAKQIEMPAGRNELILVVDDEASVREITRATLESFGYRVLLASDGTDALALYAQHGSEIQAVLTDAMMPYMDGPATIRALQQLNQQIKVIASSGLAEQERVNEMAALGVSHFLPKPYTADRLLKLLAKALQGD
jgi:CheY-like chemotaxis protein